MTSIEWLVEKLGIKEMYEDSDMPLDNILEQAKEMHKQETENLYTEKDMEFMFESGYRKNTFRETTFEQALTFIQSIKQLKDWSWK